MSGRLYTSSEVREALPISQRRMTNYAEKGLIIPVEDASGAGSKRLYNYINLLEFVLCETLFEMCLGVHLVKKIMSGLRQDEEIKNWLLKINGDYKSIKNEISDKDGDELVSSYLQGNESIGNSEIKSRTNRPYILYYIFNYSEPAKKYQDITRVMIRKQVNDLKEVLEGGGVESFKGMIAVNMTTIKDAVDKGIKNLK